MDPQPGKSPQETVLVTGASSGIGWGLARRFAEDGSRLVLVARREERLRELAGLLARDHGADCTVLACDLAHPSGAQELCDQLDELGLEIDVLVNNAGFGALGEFRAQSPDLQRDMIQVNASATTQLARRLLPGMIERRRGGVLNVASTAAFQPGPYLAVYYATKAYLRMWNDAVAHELRHHPVTFTCVCPGPTLTEFVEGAGVARTNLFRVAMPVERVVDAAYQGFRRGRKRVVPGALNKLAVFSAWFFPQWIVIRVVGRLHRVK